MVMSRQELELLEHIAMNPDPANGKPVIKGTTITVEEILGLMEQDVPISDILGRHPKISDTDVRACLLFAQKVIDDVTFMPLC